MRRMSFSATVPQMRARTKTVTRRDPSTWTTLQPGDRLLAVEKAMGLKAGERQVPIGVIEIESVDVVELEPAYWLDLDIEARREGFASWAEFMATWRRLHPRSHPTVMVRRIAFRHIEETS